mgnify:CR=1 FL=1|tara:strand:+ start:48532 stop:49308 length:777 start_codon:yes stop_codon:yes gene_type:complete
MKNAFSKLLIAGLIASTPVLTLATDGTPVVKKSAKSKTSNKAKEDAQDAASKSALITILNQIVLARFDFDIDVDFKTTQKGEESKTDIEFKYLDISALIKFKDQIQYSFVDEEKTNPQVRKVIPDVRFSTKEMFVVSKIKTGAAGKMKLTVRFCQNYSFNNDVCNTLDDKKLLDISVNSINFGSFDMRIKDITVDFDQKLADGKFAYKGSCTAWKSGFDMDTPDKTVLKPAICEFSGTYNSKAVNKFVGNFKLRSKKQ